MDQIKVIKKNKHKAGKKDFVNQEVNLYNIPDL